MVAAVNSETPVADRPGAGRPHQSVRAPKSEIPTAPPRSVELLADHSRALSETERRERFRILLKHVGDDIGCAPAVHHVFRIHDSIHLARAEGADPRGRSSRSSQPSETTGWSPAAWGGGSHVEASGLAEVEDIHQPTASPPPSLDCFLDKSSLLQTVAPRMLRDVAQAHR